MLQAGTQSGCHPHLVTVARVCEVARVHEHVAVGDAEPRLELLVQPVRVRDAHNSHCVTVPLIE